MTLQKMGYKSQHPQAEGELQATLGGRAVRTVLFDAAPDATRASGGSVTLGAGSLLGMTKGSTFALFASETAALAADATPLATATVAEVSDGSARLTLDAPPAEALPPALVAREASHAWGDSRLRVALIGAEGPSVELRGAIEALGFVEIVPASTPHDLAIEVRCCDDGETAYLLNRDDSAISNLGQTALPYLAERVRRALLPVNNVQRLRALVRQTAAQAGIQLCLSHVLDHDLRQCPTPPNAERTLVSARPLALTLTNASDAERYLYVLMIAPDFGVTQLIPAHHGRDPPILPGAAQRPPPSRYPRNTAGRCFTSSQWSPPMRRSTSRRWSRAPVRPNLSGLCVNWNGDPEADCSMAMGSVREGRVASVGQWTVTMEDAIVEKCECEP